MAKKRQQGTEAPTKVPAEAIALPADVRFYYERSPQMRTIHVDGIFGGVTSHGQIQMMPFFEAWRIPTSVAHRLSPDGAVGPELVDKRQIENFGMVRELEVRLVFDLERAKSFRKWLDDKIAVLEALQTGQPKRTRDRHEPQ